MRHETITLPYNGKTAKLTLYLLDDLNNQTTLLPRPAVLVIPGGGYHFVSPREAEPIALHFASKGFHTAVLWYNTGEDVKYPQALCEAALAMAHLRTHALEYRLDSQRIFTCGFSAGGHLALSLGVFWNLPLLAEVTGCPSEQLRPNAQILAYPVVSSDPAVSHKGSFRYLLGEEATPEELAYHSLEKQIHDQTPPTFLFTSQKDATVPCENTLRLAVALQEKKIPLELHFYGWGPHGFSDAQRTTQSILNLQKVGNQKSADPHLATWIPLCLEWLEKNFPTPTPALEPEQ